MTRELPPMSVRPEPLHEQLLRVALAPQDDVSEQWNDLRGQVDLGRVTDPNSARLLPLVFHSLRQASIDAPGLDHLKRFVLSTSGDNQLLFHRLESALETLDSVRVPSIALKGVPLAMLHYPQPGLRPMSDFDLLVKPEAVGDALVALRQAGWIPRSQLASDDVVRRFEMPCRLPSGKDDILDLHWRLVPWIDRDGHAFDRALWERAMPLTVGRHATQVPAPHDLLLHVILHAYRSSWKAVPRWVADVTLLLRGSERDLEWDVFVDRVLGARLVLPVRDALAYVSGTYDAPVADEALEALAGARTTARERHKHQIGSRLNTTERHWLLGEARGLRTAWARATVNMTRLGSLRAFAPFLRLRMQVDRLWFLPFAVARRRMHRARGGGGIT